MLPGDPVHGILSSADASSGVAVVIFKDGSNTAHTLAANEILVITDYEIIAAVSGDTHLFLGADATPGTGETIARGTVGTNGRLAGSRYPGVSAGPGLTPWLVAAAGQADVSFTGYIQQR